MTLESSVLITLRLLSFNLLLQATEIFVLSRKSDFQYIWSYKNLSLDLQSGIPVPKKIIEILFSIGSLQKIALLQILISIVTTFQPHVVGITLLFCTHLLICIRFRGSFNGGSDMMTFILLSGALIATAGFAQIGMIYIATHTIYSYFKAGLAKARNREWWNGDAIPTFLSRSLFPDMQVLANQLKQRKWLAAAAGWLTLLFELSALGLLFAPQMSLIYLAIAIVFHLSIYFSFGLNRFFWIWIGAWPATLYSLSLLNH